MTARQNSIGKRPAIGLLVLSLAALAGACGRGDESPDAVATPRLAGSVYAVRDTMLEAVFEASGVASPVRQATLSTKLMGTVLDVRVREGDAVTAGQPLVRLDARDLAAKQAQVAASIDEAEAMRRDATTQANRIRALYVDSAATRVQLDASETGLARAEASAKAAHAASAELQAVSAYAVIRAPFAGVVTKRFVDPGAFAAPGAPLIAVQDGRQLRISANVTPEAARNLRRGQTIDASIEGRLARATIEGVVPSAGNLYAVNAIVANPGGALLPGSAATLRLPLGSRSALVVPAAAVTREGELTGVTVRTAQGDEPRGVRLGMTAGTMVEVSAGLRAGDQVIVPSSNRTTVADRS
jgi:RND family efflux transporter MFP subunit